MTTKKTPAVTFTPEEAKAIQSAAWRVFEYCAGDLLSEMKSISRAVAIEVALDANRTEDQLRTMMRHKNPVVTEDLIARVSRADYQQLIKLVRPVFTFARYSA